MEENIFTDPAVAEVLSSYIEARLHTDRGANLDRTHEVQKELTGSVATPIYVVLDPDTEEKLAVFEGATFDEEEFREFLLEGLERL